jgi:hypothetical protein
MTSSSRANVVSSFTVIKGAIIDETYAVFSAWDFQVSKRENLDRLRNTNFIGASSATWLRDIAKVLNRRFDTEGRDRPLVLLAKKGLGIEEWKPLLLWHLSRDEFLVRDFLETWLFSAYEVGAFRVRPDEVESYLDDIGKRGAITEHAWSDQTKKRVAAGLPKEFASYHLPEQCFMYILHAMRDSGLSPGKILYSPAWQLFLVRPSDVEYEVLRLHQFRKLEYHVAGSIVQLDLPCASAYEYAERMVA